MTHNFTLNNFKFQGRTFKVDVDFEVEWHDGSASPIDHNLVKAEEVAEDGTLTLVDDLDLLDELLEELADEVENEAGMLESEDDRPQWEIDEEDNRGLFL
jgi:hypothetical protein